MPVGQSQYNNNNQYNMPYTVPNFYNPTPGFGIQPDGNFYGFSPNDEYQMLLRDRLMDQFRGERERDFARGRQRGEELYGNQALGRVDENRSAEVQSLLDRLQQQMGGYTGGQYQALREKGLEGIRSNTAGNLDKVRAANARAGLRGRSAAASERDVLKQEGRDVAGVYRDLVIGDINERARATGAYGGALTGARSDELSRRQYNQSQAAKELQGRLAMEFGYGQLGAADRGAAQRWIAGQQQIAAAEAGRPPATGGGGK